MKRDMDLVRKIVFALEAHPHGHAPAIKIEGYSKEQIGYHMYLMLQANLIEGLDVSGGGCESPQVEATNLTWQGHEFADDARSDTVWEKSKAVVKDKVGTVGIGLLVEVLKQQAKQLLGLP